MRVLRSLFLFSLLALIPAAFAHSQVAVGIGIGPVVAGYDGYAYGPPVCDYGYYPYYPYSCAPYGYYGSSWFAGGIFIGAAPGIAAGMAIVDRGMDTATATTMASRIVRCPLPYRGGYNGYNHTAYGNTYRGNTYSGGVPWEHLRWRHEHERLSRAVNVPRTYYSLSRTFGRRHDACL